MEAINFVVRFNRVLSSEDIDSIFINLFNLKGQTQEIPLHYLKLEKSIFNGKGDKILFCLREPDLDKFPNMKYLEDIITKEKFVIDNIDFVICRDDIFPVEIVYCMLVFEAEPERLPNGVIAVNGDRKYELSSANFINARAKWQYKA